MIGYYLEPRTKKYVKGHGFLLFARNQSNKYAKKLVDTAAKTASKRVIHKTAEATGELIRNKIAKIL